MGKPTKRKRSYASPTNRRTRKIKGGRAPAASSFKPVRLSKAKLAAQKKKKKTDGSGPLEWLLPMLESSYTPLDDRGATSRSSPPQPQAGLFRAVPR